MTLAEEQNAPDPDTADEPPFIHTLIGPITPAPQFNYKQAAKFDLNIDGTFTKKCGAALDISQTIRPAIARLSRFTALKSGDLIFIGALEQSVTTASNAALEAKIGSLGRVQVHMV